MNSDRIHQILLGPNAVAEALAAIRGFAEAEGLSPRGDVLAVIVEELVFNLVDHGGAPEGDAIELRLACSPCGVRLMLIDGGAPFDPRRAPIDAAVPERGGGAGLALVRAWSRIESYVRIGGRNYLQLLIPMEG